MSKRKSPGGKTPSTPTPTGPTFTNVDTAMSTPPATEDDVVESPSVSSSNALARFEFEPGYGTQGTKILMVEWEDDDVTRNISGDWAISWEAKRTVLPAKDVVSGGVNRFYFLLPSGERVPGTVTLTISGTTIDDSEQKTVTWKTNPLPAIFPPELGASAREAGKKGVLHTIWAKKRLQVLSKEIVAESKSNVEGVALQMAIKERDWIEQNFGVVAKPTNITISLPSASHLSPEGLPTASLSPTTPRSPGGGRLMEKLKGLRLETGDRTPPGHSLNPLSPEQSDVAVSSFGNFAAIKGVPAPSSLAAKSSQRTSSASSTPQLHAPQHPRKIAAQRPPDSVVQQQRGMSGMASLNALAGGHTGFSADVEEKEDDLFALPMSPRSPDMSKSPFSFGVEETMRHFRGERV